MMDRIPVKKDKSLPRGFIYMITQPQDEIKQATYFRDNSPGLRVPVVGVSEEKNKWSWHQDTGHFPCPHCGEELGFRFNVYFMGKISDWSLQLTEYLSPALFPEEMPEMPRPMPCMPCAIPTESESEEMMKKALKDNGLIQ